MKRSVLRSILCTLILSAFVLNGRVAIAQVLYGSLTGNVSDPSGAPVLGVHVEAINQGTNVKAETDTDVHGVYRFTNLQEDLYKITVTAKSFQTFVETNVQVQVSAIRRVDVKLQVATVNQSVEVTERRRESDAKRPGDDQLSPVGRCAGSGSQRGDDHKERRSLP